MPGLSDRRRRRRRGEARPQWRLPDRRTTVEVVTHRGKVYLRPAAADGAAAEAARVPRPRAGPLAPMAIGAALLAGVVAAAVAFMAAFSPAFEGASRALPEGSLTATRSDPARALAIDRERRREALIAIDRHIADADGDPALQEAWRDLRRREAETVERLGRYLDSDRRRPAAPADSNP